MRKTLLPLCLLGALASFGQTIDVDKNTGPLPARAFYSTGGFPLASFKYTKVASGSPYLSETWMKGALSTADSVQYSNIRLRLDLLENSIIYQNDKGEEMICVVPVVKMTLRDTVTGKAYLFVHSSSVSGAGNEKAWYQVLTAGKLTLYKQYFKDMSESKAYGSSVTEQNIRTSERYWVGVNNTLTRVKKPKEIMDVVPEKKKELGDYIDKNKLSGKKESDFIAAVEQYNAQ